MDAESIHDCLMRLTRLLQGEVRGRGLGLQPVQLEALQYLYRCNRYSDTPAAVADYMGATRGTVSQSLRALEEKGLVSRRSDPKDGRVVHLRTTSKGRRVLHSAIPPRILEQAWAGLDGPATNAVGEALRELLRALQLARGGASFGVCETCRHFREDSQGRGRPRYVCGLTFEALSARDRELVCREHEEPA